MKVLAVLFFLAMVSATALAVDCSQLSTCTRCTQSLSCNWCVSNNRCVSASESCAGENLIYIPGDCPASGSQPVTGTGGGGCCGSAFVVAALGLGVAVCRRGG